MNITKPVIIILAFLEGALFLALEILVSQLLQPVYGNSYFVWISAISIAMVASSGGYFLGSFLCKKLSFDKLTLLVPVLFLVAGLLILGLNLFFDGFFLQLFELDVFVAAVIHTSILLFLPVLVITCTSPMIVKFFDRSGINFAAKSSGMVFSLSTLGGIITVYTLSFYLIPDHGLRPSIVVFSVLAFIGSMLPLIAIKKYKVAFLMGILSVTGLLLFKKYDFNTLAHNERVNILERRHGVLGEILVEDVGYMRTLKVNRLIQSGVNLRQNTSALPYPYRISTYASLFPASSDVLIAGLGGGTLVNHMIELDFDVEAVDIDPRMMEFGKKYLGLRDNFVFYQDDIRHFLRVNDKKYDVIVFDLSRSGYMPTYAYTLEALELVKQRINPGGAIFIHHYFHSTIASNEVFYSILKTLRAAGFEIGKLYSDQRLSSETIILASQQIPLLPQQNPIRMPESVMKWLNFRSENYVEHFDKLPLDSGKVIRDDLPFLDKLQFEAVMLNRGNSRRTIKRLYFSK